ncbi:MAG: DsrE family protein [Kaistella sp.]|nr:DsrE family protein [Kaistella sp.]
MLNLIKTLFLILTLTGLQMAAQNKNPRFKPAKAGLTEYRALYVLNESDEAKILGIVKNIHHAMDDPRLKGKLYVELLAFGPGVELYRKKNGYEKLLITLKKRGVIFVQCENTLKEKNIPKADLFDFIRYTPSGNGEIILRQYEGWAVVKP